MKPMTTSKSQQYHFPKFLMSGYGGSIHPVTDEKCRELVAGGYNAVHAGWESVEDNIADINKLNEYGIVCDVLNDWRIRSLGTAAAVDQYTYEEIRDIIAAVEADYAGRCEFLGYHLGDEPSAARFPVFAMVVKALHEVNPAREAFVNLFPCYASSEQLGTPDYETYLQTFVETVGPMFIGYDNYPFVLDKNGKRGVWESHYVRNLASVRNCAADAGLDCHVIVQLDKWSEYTDEVGPTQTLWNVNLALAYGFKRIEYFTYFRENRPEFAEFKTEGFDDRMYEASKYANLKTIKVGEELLDKTSTAVFAYGALSDAVRETAYVSDAGLGEISGEGRAIIGTFDDGSVYFVNRAAYEGPASTYLLGGYTADLEWFDPESGVWKDASACAAMTKTADGWSITLSPAEAVLFRAK